MVYLVVCVVAVLYVHAVHGFGYGASLARGKPATSTSFYTTIVPAITATADLAVDGNTASDYSLGSCFSTDEVAVDPNPSWTVNLQSQNYIAGVLITNRGDCCAERLTGIRVEVFQNDPATSPETPTVCADFSGSVAAGQTVPIGCTTFSLGQYIRISKPTATSPLTMCEVIVSGSYIPSTPNSANLALFRNTLETSKYSMGAFQASANLAVDGNKNTDFIIGQSCFSSNVGDGRPTMFLDLRAFYYITSFTITNRGDCCAERLRNVYVGVLYYDPTYFMEIPRLCNTVAGNVPAGTDFTMVCPTPLVGRYIQIGKTLLLDNNDLLTMCEVQVFGRYASRAEVEGATITTDVPLASQTTGIMKQNQIFNTEAATVTAKTEEKKEEEEEEK